MHGGWRYSRGSRVLHLDDKFSLRCKKRNGYRFSHYSIGVHCNKTQQMMTDDAKNLDQLRAEIDRLDKSIHDALMQRMAVVAELAGTKGAAGSMRPAREMEVLRALAEAHEGPMPLAHVIRIWREIMSASLAFQAPFSIYLADDDNGNDNGPGFRDLARFHYGSATEILHQASAGHVIQEVSTQAGAVGVLPEPQFEEDAPWWLHLMFGDENAPRVISRLPLFEGAPGYDFPKALAISNIVQRPTGEDVSLIAVLADVNLRRGIVGEQIKAAGFDAKLTAVAPEEAKSGQRQILFEVSSFVAEDDARIEALVKKNDGVARAKIIGGYATPLHLGEASS